MTETTGLAGRGQIVRTFWHAERDRGLETQDLVTQWRRVDVMVTFHIMRITSKVGTPKTREHRTVPMHERLVKGYRMIRDKVAATLMHQLKRPQKSAAIWRR